MSKHYPGPWSAGEIDDGWADIDAYGSNHWQFARVVVQTEDDDEPQKRLIANARLIAAAPDLLEALKDAESELACYSRINSHVIDRVRAAIAKATGD